MCAAIAEAKLSAVAAGELEFDLLDGLMELVAEVALDYGDEGLDFLRLEGACAGALENFAHVVGAQEGKVMPPLEIGVDPGWNGGQDLVERAGFGVGAEGGLNELADDAGVECIAGE